MNASESSNDQSSNTNSSNLEPSNTEAGVSDWQLYRRLLSYLIPYLGPFLLSVFGFALYSAAQVGLADVLQYLVDALGDSENYDVGIISGIVAKMSDGSKSGLEQAAIIVPVSMFLLVLFRGIGFFIGNYGLAYAGRYVIHDIRTELFDRLVHLPSQYFDKNTSGHLISRITFNVDQVTGAVTNALKVVVREGTTVIFLVALLCYISWELTLVFGAVLPIIAVIVNVVGKRFRRISQRIQDSMGDVTHVASETINSYRVMRVFGGESFEKTRFRDASNTNRRQSLKMAATSALSAPTIQLVVGSAMCLLVWLMLSKLVGAHMTPGQYVEFITASGMLAKPIRQLSEVQAVIQRGLAASQVIFAQMDEEPEIDKGQTDVARIKGQVEFKDVEFRYSPDSDLVLQNINFSVSPGETVALVGSSGSGKTTLVSLLARFYDATSGEILLDGVNINDYALANLRQQFSLVNQQVTLFNESVRNNIAYGDLQSATDAEINAAILNANAKGFIDDLASGIETNVGDNGMLLSGGQRQRIAIARALLKDAPILILDEATSALDNESERHIQAELEHVMDGRTTFVIAHRLSTVEGADKILVMEGGQIVEAGSHQALLAKNSRYAKLYRTGFVETEEAS